MSQQIINISTPDDRLGDVLRNGFNKTNQNFTELYNGKVDKILSKGLSENDFTDADKTKLDGIEAGAEVNVQADFAETDPTSDSFILNKPPSLYASVGHFHYNDSATHTTPLVVLPSVPKKLTNDTLGVGTEKDFAPYGVADVWEITDNAFTFSPLDLGDQAQVRFDFLLSSTSPSQKFTLYVKFGVGSPSEYDMLVSSWVEKDVIKYGQVIRELSFSIDNENWLFNLAEIYILSDDDASVKVNGWYIPIIRKTLNIIGFNSDPLKLDKVTTSSVERTYTINADGSQSTKATSDFKDVLEFANLAAFPATGESGKIYVSLDTNLQYRWAGSAYVQIGSGGVKGFHRFQSPNFSPAANTNYYFGGSNIGIMATPQTNNRNSKISAMVSGVVKKVSFFVSAGLSTRVGADVFLENITKGTSLTIATNFLWVNIASINLISPTGLFVDKGDFLTVRLKTGGSGTDNNFWCEIVIE